MKQGTLLSVTSDDVREAADRIGPYARMTPVFATEIGGRPVTLKLENLQVTGSFKFRGALNGVIARSAGGPARSRGDKSPSTPRQRGHVVAASGGNHGENAFALLSSGAVQLALVTERAIAHARDMLWEELRLAVEPAAAVPFAAWLDGRVPGRHPCLVLCGANTDWHPA